MATLRQWLNESPGAVAAEREERARAAQTENKTVIAFDPRTEVSADAKYIVRCLVLWLLVLPAAIAAVIWLWFISH